MATPMAYDSGNQRAEAENATVGRLFLTHSERFYAVADGLTDEQFHKYAPTMDGWAAYSLLGAAAPEIRDVDFAAHWGWWSSARFNREFIGQGR